ncbi:hypothetical protein QFZ67_000351 [Streptomyces sp. V1I1]|nr:hypothetical protein [Streptomyces sp. V1I1]
MLKFSPPPQDRPPASYSPWAPLPAHAAAASGRLEQVMDGQGEDLVDVNMYDDGTDRFPTGVPLGSREAVWRVAVKVGR